MDDSSLFLNCSDLYACHTLGRRVAIKILKKQFSWPKFLLGNKSFIRDFIFHKIVLGTVYWENNCKLPDLV